LLRIFELFCPGRGCAEPRDRAE